MKSIIAMTLTILLANSAHAERWIVKNPKQEASVEFMRGVSSNSSMSLNGNNYLFLDLSTKMTAKQIAMGFNADSAFEDLKIVIDKPIESDSQPEQPIDAWHVRALKYSELNQKYTGQGVIVAVIDTGVDYKHPNLKARMWKNVKEIPNNKIDDDGNGLVDDYDGYNFADNVSSPMDTNGHGTHCSGIIAAVKDTNSDAQGVAPGVKIMPLKVITDNDAGFLSGAALAVKYATDNGAKVLSNSWRIYNSWSDFMNLDAMTLVHDAIAYADNHGVIFVAAAGNEKKNLDVTNLTDAIYPLSFKDLHNMVGVASSSLKKNAAGEEYEELSSYSNYGATQIPVAAPGENIYSTIPGGKWRFLSGTSMATPIVSGTIARGLSKGYSKEEAMSELNQKSQKSTYWQQYVIHGRIDIQKYLE